MSLDRSQFRDLIGRTLRNYRGLYSEAAVNLLLGTAAQETHFGTYLRQLGGGPALGIFQMEEPTFVWLHTTYKGLYPELVDRVFKELEWDLGLAIVFARLRYRIVPTPLPGADDIDALARYWKRYYNTARGAGTVNQFKANYQRFVA